MAFGAGGVKLDIEFYYENDTFMWHGATEVQSGEKFKLVILLLLLCMMS